MTGTEVKQWLIREDLQRERKRKIRLEVIKEKKINVVK